MSQDQATALQPGDRTGLSLKKKKKERKRKVAEGKAMNTVTEDSVSGLDLLLGSDPEGYVILLIVGIKGDRR